jgi:parallel beta-helix repeat protein
LDSSGNTLESNTTSDNGSGIVLEASSDNTLTGNTANENVTGILLGSEEHPVDGNILINNIANSNSVSGIQISHATNHTLTGNTTSSYSSSYDSHGILMRFSSDNTLTGNTASYNSRGIVLSGCSRNTLTGNIAENNSLGVVRCGIKLSDSNDNRLTDNIANSNNARGIVLDHSSGNTLEGNTVSSSVVGIHLLDSSGNTLERNTTSDNGSGIVLEASSDNNILIDNIASDNTWDGIGLSCSSINTLTGNTITLNNRAGIYLISSSNNDIYHNNFIDNTEQARVEGGSGNVFNLDRPIGGNCWSDHTGPDKNRDGFVDLPYVFTGGTDDLPWVAQGGWTALLIDDLITTVESYNLQQGINNSLDAKLEAAQHALTAANAGQRNDAVNKLEAFINEVEAQRGEKLTDEQADELVTHANNIITSLGGTPVARIAARILPSEPRLAQNYPNPFNPVTTIAYGLAEATDVTLTIYTVTGQEIAVVVDAHQEAGHHAALFDASGYANGFYLYRLEAGSFVETKRMLLLK